MMLLTKPIKEALKKAAALEEKPPIEETPIVVKFFTPDSSWTWYATEGQEQEDGDWLFYGLVDGLCKEYGYFTLNELKKVRGRFGLPVERDRGFSKLIKEVM